MCIRDSPKDAPGEKPSAAMADLILPHLEMCIRDSLNGASLKAGDRLIIKLRLPHTEWEGEEVD